MQSEEKVIRISKSVKDGFGFNENDVSSSVSNESSIFNETSPPIEFRPDKPYRLALYVRPNEQRRIQRANASLLVKSIMEKQRKARKMLNNTICSPVGKSESGKGKKRERKLNVSLFDDKLKPETKPKSSKKLGDNPKSKKNVTITETSPTRRNILAQSNIKTFQPTLRQASIKRLYERKVRVRERENIPDEPPSDEILKDLEEKKLWKAKMRKFNTDEDKNDDFEDWASNVNSDFNDVDQFEMSVSYD